MDHNRNKYKLLFKDTLIFGIGSIGSRIILFFLVPFYTAYLSTEEFGISNLVFTVSQFLIPLMSLEVFDAVLRFGLSKTYKKEDVIKNALFVIIIDIILSILIYPVLGLYYAIREWRVYLLLFFLLSIVNSTVLNYLKVCEKNKAYAGINIVQTVVLCIANIILIAFLNFGIRGYLIANVFSLLVSSIFAILIGNVWNALKTGNLNLFLMKEMLVYSSPLVLNSISWWFISSSDKVMIETLINSSELGVYTVAAKIPALINVFIAIFQQAWGISSIKEIESSIDSDFFSCAFKYYNLIVFTACFIALSVIHTFMSIYIRGGAEFSSAVYYVPFLLVSAVFSAISTFYGSLYTALKQTDRIMITTLISGTINVIVNYFAIKTIGTMGAVIGTVAAYFLIAIFRMVDMERFISININYSKSGVNLIMLFVFAFYATVSDKDNVFVSTMFLVLFFIINYKDYSTLFKNLKQHK